MNDDDDSTPCSILERRLAANGNVDLDEEASDSILLSTPQQYQGMTGPEDSASHLPFKQSAEQQSVFLKPKPVALKLSWIDWFISLEGHEFLVSVPREFFDDKFNLLKVEEELGFKQPRVKECLKLLLSKDYPSKEDLQKEEFFKLNQDASDFYAHVHARFMRSPEGKKHSKLFLGMAILYGRYLTADYGHCPRALCDK